MVISRPNELRVRHPPILQYGSDRLPTDLDRSAVYLCERRHVAAAVPILLGHI